MADGNAALQSVITGESDILAGVPYTAVEPTRQSNPDLTIIDYDTTLFNFYHTYQDEGALFADVIPCARRCTSRSTAQLVADIAYQGFASRQWAPSRCSRSAYAPDRINTVYNYDPDRARPVAGRGGLGRQRR